MLKNMTTKELLQLLVIYKKLTNFLPAKKRDVAFFERLLNEYKTRSN